MAVTEQTDTKVFFSPGIAKAHVEVEAYHIRLISTSGGSSTCNNQCDVLEVK